MSENLMLENLMLEIKQSKVFDSTVPLRECPS